MRCPAALAKLDQEAPKHAAQATFASCALSLNSTTEGTQEQVLEQLEGQFENLKHCYMTFEEKEKAKAAFGFSAVPFCIIFNAAGAILFKGDPKDVDFATFDFAGQPAETEATVDAAAKQLEAVQVGASKTVAPVGQPAKPLGEANREGVALGFGNDDEDF